MEIWRGKQEGLNAVIVNPGVIIGPSFKEQGSGKLFKNVKNGMPFYTKGNTGFIAVTDVVKIMFDLVKSEIKNERFILIAENGKSVYEKAIGYRTYADKKSLQKTEYSLKKIIIIRLHIDGIITRRGRN